MRHKRPRGAGSHARQERKCVPAGCVTEPSLVDPRDSHRLREEGNFARISQRISANPKPDPRASRSRVQINARRRYVTIARARARRIIAGINLTRAAESLDGILQSAARRAGRRYYPRKLH